MEKLTGIVLRVTPWRESSVIATVLTDERGKVRGVCRGARKGKGVRRATVEPGMAVHGEGERRPSWEMWTFRSLETDGAGRFSSGDPVSMNAGFALLDLFDRFLAEEQREEAMLRLMRALLGWLQDAATEGARCAALVYGLGWLARLQGHIPTLEACPGCGSEADTTWRLAPDGTLACPACVPSGSRSLAASVRRELASYLRLDPAAAALHAGADAPSWLRPAERFLLHVLEHTLGHPLKSWEVYRKLEAPARLARAPAKR